MGGGDGLFCLLLVSPWQLSLLQVQGTGGPVAERPLESTTSHDDDDNDEEGPLVMMEKLPVSLRAVR